MADFYGTEKYNTGYSTFGGIVLDYDFGRHMTMAETATRIMSDLIFDIQCKKNIENRNRTK